MSLLSLRPPSNTVFPRRVGITTKIGSIICWGASAHRPVRVIKTAHAQQAGFVCVNAVGRGMIRWGHCLIAWLHTREKRCVTRQRKTSKTPPSTRGSYPMLVGWRSGASVCLASNTRSLNLVASWWMRLQTSFQSKKEAQYTIYCQRNVYLYLFCVF